MIAFSCGGTDVEYDVDTLAFHFTRNGHRWDSLPGFSPTLTLAGHGEPVPFGSAESVTHERRSFGTGEGVVSRFVGVSGTAYAFETFLWVEASSGEIVFEWMPLNEDGPQVTRIDWPAPLTFDEPRADWATLVTHCQGTMIPNDWPTELGEVPFAGRFGTEGGYMPFFAQLRGVEGLRANGTNGDGYVAICETPWNAGYAAEHPAGGPFTHIHTWFEPSLGRMDYRRVVRYIPLDSASVTDAAKTYRRWADEHGHGRTLAEKATRNPSVRDLTGRMWLHVGAKTLVRPDSRLYDAEHPERNEALVPFAAREAQLRQLHELGVDNVFMHLDGWGQPGYDNEHPDYCPACREAGGWEGLKALADTAHDYGMMFGLHDQYRDYYYSARSHDVRNAVRLADGTVPEHAWWAGGRQNYLCGTLAQDYVKRNYREIAAHGVKLDCTYLDVFTCNEGDECANPEHRMSRRECLEARGRCFSWLLAQGILTSSEEVSDWAMDSLVFCHYAPYDFQMRDPRAPREGVPVPLQNLVWHDCVIEPWMMERIEGGEDYMLYALLNGGAPYLVRDAAYAGFDGDAGDAAARAKLEDDITRCQTVCDLHRRVALLEMTGFEFVGGDTRVQRTTFADGTTVTVDFAANTYVIA